MPALLVLLLIGVLAWLWLARRGRTLTRACRWREDRTTGSDVWRCAACGAVTHGTPRDCLRGRD